MEARNESSLNDTKRLLYLSELNEKYQFLIGQSNEILMNMIKVIDLVFKPGEKHDPEIADRFLKMIDDKKEIFLDSMEMQKSEYIFGDSGFQAEVSFFKDIVPNESTKSFDAEEETLDDDRNENKNSSIEEDSSNNDNRNEDKKKEYQFVRYMVNRVQLNYYVIDFVYTISSIME